MTSSATTGAALTLPLQVAFQPMTGPGPAQPTAFTLACNATGALDLAVNLTVPGNETIVGNLSDVTCNLTVASSAVGSVAVSLLGDMITFVLGDVVVPTVNKALAAGIPLPSLAGLSLVDSEVAFGDGYVLMGTDLAFSGNLTAMLGGRRGAALPTAPAGKKAAAPAAAVKGLRGAVPAATA
jgi:hypothetical protein